MFGQITTAAAGHELAILVDGRLITAPTVAEPIHTAVITIAPLTKSLALRLARGLNNPE
jgi:preprotein translocase subunit SecD